VVTGRRLMTAGRSRGGNIRVLMGRVRPISDLIVGVGGGCLSASSSSVIEGRRTLTDGRLRRAGVVGPRFGASNISLVAHVQ